MWGIQTMAAKGPGEPRYVVSENVFLSFKLTPMFDSVAALVFPTEGQLGRHTIGKSHSLRCGAGREC